VREMLELMRREALVVPLVNLPRLAALIARCDLFIGNDTGIFHLAAAVGTRSIGLFGPTDPGQWKPSGQRVVSLRAEGNNLSRLSISEVSRLAIKELLKK
jgi:heptosyltransferase-3